jgi:nucleotide sugar dehydrogenase
LDICSGTNIWGKQMKVCVVGLGTVGLPTAIRCLMSGHDVYGIDIDDSKVMNAQLCGIRAYQKWCDLTGSIDVFLVCVNTGTNNFHDFTPDIVYSVCEEIFSRGYSGLLIIESTLYPGIVDRIAKMRPNTNMSIGHVPHRFWPNDPEKRGVSVKRVASGIDEKSRALIQEFYDTLYIKIVMMSSTKTAEFIKVAENACRFVQIALAEEIKMMCDRFGLDFVEVRDGINTHFAHNILEARNGIGGECVPLAINMLCSASTHLLYGAIEADKKYKKILERSK